MIERQKIVELLNAGPMNEKILARTMGVDITNTLYQLAHEGKIRKRIINGKAIWSSTRASELTRLPLLTENGLEMIRRLQGMGKAPIWGVYL